MVDLKKINLIVLDVDGTLTDGGIYYDSQENEMKRFDVKDGLGIKVAISAGIEFAILTGRKSPMVAKRAKELGIQEVREGIQHKFSSLLELVKEKNLELSEVGYIGDDWNDLQCMEQVGFRACPVDAAEEIKEICDFVSCRAGGYGAVRECIEWLLKKQNRWEQYVTNLYIVEERKRKYEYSNSFDSYTCL